MQEKKQKSPLLVVITILFLLCFIVLPPVFRTLIPKEEVDSPESKKKTIQVLSCTGMKQEEAYEVVSKINYIDNEPKKNVITYTKLTNDDVNNAVSPDNMPPIVSNDDTTTPLIKTVAEELMLFKSVSGLNITEEQNITSVVITDDDIINNSSNLELAMYLQDSLNQRTYYESQGYVCELIEY